MSQSAMTTKTEERAFSMHPNLLMDVIQRQAGTLSKAILELVMNSIDAGATSIVIKAQSDSVSVVDNGKGFTDRAEIEQFFETFGTPHQEGDAIYGRFRMGRGQAFAFGNNLWKSNKYIMDVDVKNKGLDYILTEHDNQVHSGCDITIDLYDRMSATELQDLERELADMIAYSQTNVTFNGNCLNEDTGTMEWTCETDEAYFFINPDSRDVKIYNIGVLVERVSAWSMGTGGIVVSKNALDVNFARNQVLRNSPGFKKIKAELERHAGKDIKKKKTLNEEQRRYIAQKITTGDFLFDEEATILRTPILHTVTGYNYDLGSLYEYPKWKDRDLPFILAPYGHRAVEGLQKMKQAVGITDKTLERFNAKSPDEMLRKIAAGLEHYIERARAEGPNAAGRIAEKIYEGIITSHEMDPDKTKVILDNDYQIIHHKDMTVGDKMLLRGARKAYSFMHNALVKNDPAGIGIDKNAIRNLVMGKSSNALGWTDGNSFIAIDQKTLRQMRQGIPGATRIAQTILHEMCHDRDNTGSHVHDEAFYETFHNRALHNNLMGAAVQNMLATFLSQVDKARLKKGASLLNTEEILNLTHDLWPDESTFDPSAGSDTDDPPCK